MLQFFSKIKTSKKLKLILKNTIIDNIWIRNLDTNKERQKKIEHF
jgi:hypothetical protein